MPHGLTSPLEGRPTGAHLSGPATSPLSATSGAGTYLSRANSARVWQERRNRSASPRQLSAPAGRRRGRVKAGAEAFSKSNAQQAELSSWWWHSCGSEPAGRAGIMGVAPPKVRQRRGLVHPCSEQRRAPHAACAHLWCAAGPCQSSAGPACSRAHPCMGGAQGGGVECGEQAPMPWCSPPIACADTRQELQSACPDATPLCIRACFCPLLMTAWDGYMPASWLALHEFRPTPRHAAETRCQVAQGRRRPTRAQGRPRQSPAGCRTAAARAAPPSPLPCQRCPEPSARAGMAGTGGGDMWVG